MQSFVYSYPTKVYFGQGAARQALEAELSHYGPTYCWPTAAARSSAPASMTRWSPS